MINENNITNRFLIIDNDKHTVYVLLFGGYFGFLMLLIGHESWRDRKYSSRTNCLVVYTYFQVENQYENNSNGATILKYLIFHVITSPFR